jgi:hypothetical protein
LRAGGGVQTAHGTQVFGLADVVFSLIPELEDVIQQGSPERRAETLKRITAFFSMAPASSATIMSDCSTRCSAD